MPLLDSKNYKTVAVRFRDNEDLPFLMPRVTGDRLMDFLSLSHAPSKHVTLTDVKGLKRAVHTSEIVSAQPVYDGPPIDESIYKNLAELKADRKPSVQADVLEVSDEVRQHRLEVIRKMKEDFKRKRGL